MFNRQMEVEMTIKRASITISFLHALQDQVVYLNLVFDSGKYHWVGDDGIDCGEGYFDTAQEAESALIKSRNAKILQC